MPDLRPSRAEPVGVVLAGGAARRFGGEKMTAELGGRPLVAHALGVLRAAVAEVVVAAREGVALPPALDAPVWLEPGDAPRHPLAGIALALRKADGPVLVLAGDMPWVPEALLLAVRDAPGDGAAVARGPGGAEPLVGRYVPANAAALWEAALAGERARVAVAALDPVWIDWGDAGALRSANTPGDLSSA